jgi:hypothetical protein
LPKLLTNLLLNSELDQAVVFTTSEEAPPANVPQGPKFLTLIEKARPRAAYVSTAA